MARQCSDQRVHTAVTIACKTTKCRLPTGAVGQHVIEIVNQRAGGDIHQIETTSTTLYATIDFGSPSAKKSVCAWNILSNQASANRCSIPVSISHGGSPNTDELQTTVEFFDASQRVGNTFRGARESYDVDYLINLT